MIHVVASTSYRKKTEKPEFVLCLELKGIFLCDSKYLQNCRFLLHYENLILRPTNRWHMNDESQATTTTKRQQNDNKTPTPLKSKKRGAIVEEV